MSEEELIDKYLTHFCELNNGSLEEFSQIFTERKLRGIEKQMKVYLAKNGIVGLEKDIDVEFYHRIADHVILKLTEDNKENFRVDEGITLRVKLKNIDQLVIKIFEFNTETYYRKNKEPFDNNVNLDGLHAAE